MQVELIFCLIWVKEYHSFFDYCEKFVKDIVIKVNRLWSASWLVATRQVCVSRLFIFINAQLCRDSVPWSGVNYYSEVRCSYVPSTKFWRTLQMSGNTLLYAEEFQCCCSSILVCASIQYLENSHSFVPRVLCLWKREAPFWVLRKAWVNLILLLNFTQFNGMYSSKSCKNSGSCSKKVVRRQNSLF